VTGIFVTHYHHDHNPGVPKVAEFFSAPVYGVEPLADILERPGAYRMPCLHNVTIPIVRKNDGETMRWNEFELTFFDFPGQTLYHNALLVRRVTEQGKERPVLFIGDSFTPTGIDDYCAWNRNLLQDGKGYLYCLEKIRNLDPSPMLVNAHVDPPFEFDTARLDYMERALRERMKLLADLLAVPEINFGIDHAWCRFDPFVSTIPAGESTVLKTVITNHFDKTCTFHVALEPSDDFPFDVSPEPIRELTIAPGQEQSVAWTLKPTSEKAGNSFLSAKVTTVENSLAGRCEAVIQTLVK
jgi:glyoxylase-like metal-dependent hydrolase (beta-lactamase superfamily II)